MIERIEKIATTEESHPFAAAAVKCGFAEKGYLEEEYFIHGSSNVYGWKEGRKTVIFPECPYTNKMCIRDRASASL